MLGTVVLDNLLSFSTEIFFKCRVEDLPLPVRTAPELPNNLSHPPVLIVFGGSPYKLLKRGPWRWMDTHRACVVDASSPYGTRGALLKAELSSIVIAQHHYTLTAVILNDLLGECVRNIRVRHGPMEELAGRRRSKWVDAEKARSSFARLIYS